MFPIMLGPWVQAIIRLGFDLWYNSVSAMCEQAQGCRSRAPQYKIAHSQHLKQLGSGHELISDPETGKDR